MTWQEAVVCPLCARGFAFEPRLWRCAQGHSFDLAREGYVNLLPVQHKHSREPGDQAQAIEARRAFLEAGHYGPLREALVAMLAPLRPGLLLDVGCGEGWYTSAFARAATEVIGLDIAKPAVRLAAKRFRGPTWIVGSGARLPLADASVDALCTLFTPLHESEIARVLVAGGSAIVVTPGVAHLQELRAALFETVQPHEPDKFLRGFEGAFTLAQRDDVRVPLALDRTALQQLVAMTPYAWKARPERRAAVEALARLDTRGEFTLMRFVKRAELRNAT
jgi:23S rRNA (guanine745-N1)-methyltransferase